MEDTSEHCAEVSRGIISKIMGDRGHGLPHRQLFQSEHQSVLAPPDRERHARIAKKQEARLNPFFWYGSSIEKRTDYTLKKLAAIAEAAGTSFDRAVKAEVYIAHPNDFAGMERVWKRWFPNDPPARVVIPYMGLAGKGSKIEIALTLLANDAKIKKRRSRPRARRRLWDMSLRRSAPETLSSLASRWPSVRTAG